MKLETVLSDADGVIFVTEHLQYLSWLPFLEGLDVKNFSKEDYRDNCAGNSGLFIAEYIINKYNLSIKPSTLRAQKEGLVKQLFEEKEPELFPYARKALEYFSNNFNFALVTGAPLDEAKMKIERSGLSTLLKDIPLVTADDIPKNKGKPDPDHYLIGLEKMNANPKTTIVLEDTVPGIQSAQAAGIKKVFGIPHEYVNSKNYPKGTIIKPNLKEVVQYTKTHFS